MKYSEIIDITKEWVISFGAHEGSDFIFRNNTGREAFTNGEAYFGFIQPEEGHAGAYHDFSLVVFPDEEDGVWVVSLGVGSLGFRNDYELAAQPGIRRRYLRLIDKSGFIKTSFLDIQSRLPRDFISKANNINRSLEKYKKVLPVCEIIDPTSKIDMKKIKGFLALYADIRGWASNAAHRRAIKEAISEATERAGNKESDEDKVKNLLKTRKFVVLQGAPGTGKTRLAKKLAEEDGDRVYFTQFHAETTFSEFVSGIRPALNSNDLKYIAYEGILVEAIRYAKVNPDKKVYLVIDEINRANLANVLGPVFYLFEYQMEESNVEIKLSDDLKITEIPDQLYIIATMNTADRSLAVVDFALRRRFAWFTLNPTEINEKLDGGKKFYKKDFEDITAIFEQYASDEELNLQPGQGYFIAKDDTEMNARISYELMPLIKEYLVEGMLLQGKDSFVNYFYDRINEVMFR